MKRWICGALALLLAVTLLAAGMPMTAKADSRGMVWVAGATLKLDQKGNPVYTAPDAAYKVIANEPGTPDLYFSDIGSGTLKEELKDLIPACDASKGEGKLVGWYLYYGTPPLLSMPYEIRVDDPNATLADFGGQVNGWARYVIAPIIMSELDTGSASTANLVCYANGGQFEDGSIKCLVGGKDNGHIYDYWAAPPIPTREGYTFLGWAQSKSATEADYQPGTPIQVKDLSLEYDGTVFYLGSFLYAVWQKNETPEPPTPTPTPPDTVTIEVTATWDEEKWDTVYDPAWHGNVKIVLSPYNVEGEWDVTLTQENNWTASVEVPGYDKDGKMIDWYGRSWIDRSVWYKYKTASETYNWNEDYSVYSISFQLVPGSASVDTYLLYFYPNGGEMKNSSIYDMYGHGNALHKWYTVFMGSEIERFEPVREGYTFMGWAEMRKPHGGYGPEDMTATVPDYLPGDYVIVTYTDFIETGGEPIFRYKTLYAVWQKDEEPTDPDNPSDPSDPSDPSEPSNPTETEPSGETTAPTVPTVTIAPTEPAETPKTGDEAPLGLWVLRMTLSAVVIAALTAAAVWRRNQAKY